jgi:putative PIN family toxin of toxin-antitoxin system
MTVQGRPIIVIDTNIVLEALVFGDAHAVAVKAAVVRGDWLWLATPAMRDEFERVLQRPSLRRWNPDPAALRIAFGSLATLVEPAASSLLRCRDPDDQIFIDLALAFGARWLLTRDRALLALRRPAARAGLEIAPPEGFVAAESVAKADPLAEAPK